MAALSCNKCRINYPAKWEDDALCPACGGELIPYTHRSPTPNWERVVERKRLEGSTPDAVEEFDKKNAKVTKVDVRYEPITDTFWVKSEDLSDAGFTNLETFDVVELNGRYWELLGMKNRWKMWEKREWWIEEINPRSESKTYLDTLPEKGDGTSDDILSFHEGNVQIYFNPNRPDDIIGVEGDG